MSEKQHCDRAENGGGKKNSGRPINVCLRGSRKNLIILGRIFSSLLRPCVESGGEENDGDVIRKGRVGELHFRVPHENDVTPAAVG